jgi:hypothetical protein
LVERHAFASLGIATIGQSQRRIAVERVARKRSEINPAVKQVQRSTAVGEQRCDALEEVTLKRTVVGVALLVAVAHEPYAGDPVVLQVRSFTITEIGSATALAVVLDPCRQTERRSVVGKQSVGGRAIPCIKHG